MKQVALLIVIVGFLATQISGAFVVNLHEVATKKTVKFEDVDPDNMSIGELKRLIQEKLRIDVTNQRLIHGHKLIRDDSKLISQLAYYNPTSVSIFLAEPLKQRSMIIVNFSNHKESRIVSGDESLKTLRRNFIGEGRIYFDDLELVDDDKTLDEYQIYSSAFLYVLRKEDKFSVEIEVNYDSNWLTTNELFTINSETSVEDLKKMIEERTNISVDKQKLVVNESEITGDSKIISYCTSPLQGQKLELYEKRSD